MTVSIANYMTMICTYEKFVGRDSSGNPTYEAPITVPCRWSRKPSRVLGFNGVMLPSSGNVHVQFPVNNNDRFTIDDLGDGQIQRTPLEIHNNYQKDGSFAYAKVIL